MAFTVRTVSITTDTPTNSDDEAFIRFTNGSTSTITLDTDANQTWAAGTIFSFVGESAQVNVDPAVGVNVNDSTITRTVNPDQVASLINPNGDDNWYLVRHFQIANQMTVGGNFDMSDNSILQIGAAEFDVLTTGPGSSATPNVANNSIHIFDANANFTINEPTNEAASGELSQVVLFLRQDGTGGRTWSFPSSFIWAGGAVPTFSTDGGDIDIVTALTFDGGVEWFAWLNGRFAS